MSSRLADRLNHARRRRFVGRAAELALFQAALDAPELPFHVLYIFGPGGIGKTSLLGELRALSERAGTLAIYLDARNLEPSPAALDDALRHAMALAPSESPLDVLASHPGRQVLFLDTYEAIVPLDDWLRESFLPSLPEETLVVIAARQAPAPAWRADPGWQDLVRVLPLRNFRPEESLEYLTRREIPAEQRPAVLDFTHGHPLALSLVADVFAQRPNVRFQPEAAPDVVKTLLEQFAQKVPGPAHRAALEVCTLVRLTTEGLLAEVLSMPDAHDLFEWLRGLSFVEAGPLGIFPHDLAREALDADLRWRNPEWYAELHRRAGAYYARRLQQAPVQEQQRILIDYIFLHRENPVVRPFFAMLKDDHDDHDDLGVLGEPDGLDAAGRQVPGGLLVDAARGEDEPAIVGMVERHEGRESARLAARWLARQPASTLVLRNARRQVAGFLTLLDLQRIAEDDRRADPATRAAWTYLRAHAPLRAGEGATLFRFWMAHDTYQAVSPVQSLIFVNMVRHYLTTPGLAYTLLPCAEPEFWQPMFAYADLARLPESDFTVDGRRYGIFGHDWRAVPPLAWLALLADREVGATPRAAPAARTPPAEPLVVLSEPEFAASLRRALHDYTRPDALRANPLLRSRLVAESAGPGASSAERVATLQRLLLEASESLLPSPRDAKLHRALDHTYFHPAPTQERAAEALDLPFSTYRRHLKEGIDRLTEMLWQREIGGPDRPGRQLSAAI